ncbi:hypothetical protein [Mangrovimonas xylaniphaga]|uniref:hypothetical protein n=1 Tax=Mangrovimonas xylaniphaga TaxID=1645915 RepID=UPI0006B5A81F|nr:hypothetical protein [Mangrovimonas xylaniphaga]
MKKTLIFTFGIVLISCANSQKKEDIAIKSEEDIEIPCPLTWQEYKPTEDELEFEVNNGIITKKPNDSTIQQIRFGRVWFEMINPIKLDGGAEKCYLKNYRTDGSLESEGHGIYYEHPVADYSMDGVWKFYSCDGNLKEEVKFKNGQKLKN